jgi:hypothetical protein
MGATGRLARRKTDGGGSNLQHAEYVTRSSRSMGILSSTKERVKSAVPGLKTKQRKMSEAERQLDPTIR